MRNYFPDFPSLLRFSGGIISALNKTRGGGKETNHVRALLYCHDQNDDMGPRDDDGADDEDENDDDDDEDDEDDDDEEEEDDDDDHDEYDDDDGYDDGCDGGYW